MFGRLAFMALRGMARHQARKPYMSPKEAAAINRKTRANARAQSKYYQSLDRTGKRMWRDMTGPIVRNNMQDYGDDV
jgi:hypothetical protein